MIKPFTVSATSHAGPKSSQMAATNEAPSVSAMISRVVSPMVP
jgi:hypothetical protein